MKKFLNSRYPNHDQILPVVCIIFLYFNQKILEYLTGDCMRNVATSLSFRPKHSDCAVFTMKIVGEGGNFLHSSDCDYQEQE